MSGLRYEDVAPNPLFLALVRGAGPAAALVDGLIDDGTGVVLQAAAARAAQRDLPRADLSAALLARLESLGAPEESLAGARRLAEPGTVAVVAGQQPGLFGGPHLVLGKALVAVATARRLTAAGTPAVPVFWSAAEDHDHAEADHVSVIDPDGAPRRLRLRLPEDGRMLSRVPVPAAAATLAEELGGLLSGEHADAVRALIPPGDAATVGDWFARTILGLLGRFGVVLAEPETLRPFARPVLEHEFAEPGRFAEDVRAAEAGLAEAGFAPPLALRRDALFFRVRDGARVPFSLEDGRFVERDGASQASSELAAEAADDPLGFSWNVVTRVLAQNAALPVAAQVCGPAELCYVALTSASHQRLGLSPPALVPRTGVTFVDAGVARRCERLGVTPEDVVAHGDLAVPAVSERPEAPEIAAAREALDRLPEGTSRAARRRREAILREIGLFADALSREHTEADRAAASRRAHVLAALRPGGALQERKLSALPWIAKAGTVLLDQVLEALPGEEHVLVATHATTTEELP